jgi:general secretion pathway protein G
MGSRGGSTELNEGTEMEKREVDMTTTTTRKLARNTRRAIERGVTLVEILIVLAIMSLISGGVVVAVIPRYNKAQVDAANNSARGVRDAVIRWKATGGEGCPTVSQLVQDKQIDTASKVDDPWGSAYKIACTEDEVIVSSAGPDKKEGTADDISIPKK